MMAAQELADPENATLSPQEIHFAAQAIDPTIALEASSGGANYLHLAAENGILSANDPRPEQPANAPIYLAQRYSSYDSEAQQNRFQARSRSDGPLIRKQPQPQEESAPFRQPNTSAELGLHDPVPQRNFMGVPTQNGTPSHPGYTAQPPQPNSASGPQWPKNDLDKDLSRGERMGAVLNSVEGERRPVSVQMENDKPIVHNVEILSGGLYGTEEAEIYG
ncbi:hypothetical protein MAIT1_05234 [Magnetofaba australis IT-1]|uniref:Uncharacterized protein n=2 Tax=Magnetofaba TaxID=1472292 RepID=A0A1Y2K6I2_9PROT|nr:hypothetical protein MAIT1_05234 [Magnetofaba australis IT-1]